jgi:hypothetical protein
MKVDGEVLELFVPRDGSIRRFLLEWLFVRVAPSRKDVLEIAIGSDGVDQAIYALAKSIDRQTNTFVKLIKAGDEPVYRAFFSEVAGLCGRLVAPPNAY